MRDWITTHKRAVAGGGATVLVGLALIAGSFFTEDWTQSISIEIGASLLLFGPLAVLQPYLFDRQRTAIRQDQQEAVTASEERTGAEIAALATQVTSLRDQMDSQTTGQRNADFDLAQRLPELDSIEDLVTLIDRAQQQRAFTADGLRVQTPLMTRAIRFKVEEDRFEERSLRLAIEDEHGVAEPLWDIDDTTTQAFLASLTDALTAGNDLDSPADFNAVDLLEQLRTDITLLFNAKYGTDGSRPLEPAWQVVNNYWVVTDHGLQHIREPWDIPWHSLEDPQQSLTGLNPMERRGRPEALTVARGLDAINRRRSDAEALRLLRGADPF